MNHENANNQSNNNEPHKTADADYRLQVRLSYDLISQIKLSRPHLRPQIEILEGVVTRAHYQLAKPQPAVLSTASASTHAVEMPTAREATLERINIANRCLLALKR